MKNYKVPYQEEIRVWQNCTAYIETDDTPEQIYKHMQDGDFMFYYDCGLSTNDVMFETEELLDYNFDNTEIEDIREI